MNTAVPHLEVSHTVFFVIGMALHVVARYFDWRNEHPKTKFATFLSILLRKKFITAQVMSLLVLTFWATDFPIAGITMSSFVPHTNIVALVLGYMSDSVSKYAVNRIPFLQKKQ